MTDTTDETIGLPEDPADFDLLGWLESGTVAERDVVHYNDPGALADYEAADRELDALGYTERTQDDGDGPLSAAPDPDVEAALERRGEAYERLVASKAVYRVRAISADELEDAVKAVPVPKMPRPPKENAPRPVQDEYDERMRRFVEAGRDADRERRLVIIATGLLYVSTPRGRITGTTADTLRALRGRPGGQQLLDRLYDAIDAATGQDVELPRPTQPGRSTSTRG